MRFAPPMAALDAAGVHEVIVPKPARSGGTVVAETRDDLTDTELTAPIMMTQWGDELIEQVWTGTGSDGSATGNDCDGWSAGFGAVGTWGYSNAVNVRWTINDDDLVGPGECSRRRGLYCVETP